MNYAQSLQKEDLLGESGGSSRRRGWAVSTEEQFYNETRIKKNDMKKERPGADPDDVALKIGE